MRKASVGHPPFSTKTKRLGIVLLPGMDGTGELFSEFAATLSGEFDIATVRYPTERCLSCSELDDLVRAACPAFSRFVLLAESYSTPLAIKYAASNPENLEALILSAGFATSPARGWRRSLGWFLAPAVFHVPMPDFAAKHWLVGANAPPSLLAAVRAAVSSVKPRVLAARLRAVLTCDVRGSMSKITVPTLYLRPEQDRLVSDSCVEELVRINPKMAVAALEGPHLLLQRQPQRAAEAIVRFIRSI